MIDLATKKYVDDQDSRMRSACLSLTGGTMSGNIVMGNNKIITTADPVSDKDLSWKKYVDDEVGKKINKTGGRITGRMDFEQDIYMGSGKYIHNLMTTVPGPNVLISKGFADSSYIKQGGN